jgi:UDP-N-acetylmuramate dehydrogenase
MEQNYQAIIDHLGPTRVKQDEPLSKHSYIKIGGPADLFFTAKSRQDLIDAVQLALKHQVPFAVLGWGSNTLISDQGFRGLVIKNKYQHYQILQEPKLQELKPAATTKHKSTKHSRQKIDQETRRQDVKKKNPSSTTSSKNESNEARQIEWQPALTYNFSDLDYQEPDAPEVLVKVSSGYSLPKFISKMLNKGLTGLQWYAGIPGTIAGAVYNNIHGGKKLFGSRVKKATIIKVGNTNSHKISPGELQTVDQTYFDFAYNKSQMHNTQDVLIDITLSLKRGDVERAKHVQQEWRKRKSVQPQNSLGCTYANPPQSVTDQAGYPTTSVGYFVEHVMGWQDKKVIGGASMGRGNGHAAFICNQGTATAQDYLQLMKQVATRYQQETGYQLRPEIFFLGEFAEGFKAKNHSSQPQSNSA